MGFVPGCENDIFISYTHVDNDPLIEGRKGWVDFFEDLLRKRIRVRLGKEVEIFRDPQLRGYGKFSEQLADKISTCAAFISVLSPRYLESDWCSWELGEFYKRAGAGRIIKVVKSDIYEQTHEQSRKPEIRALLAEIKDVRDYKFYRKVESSGLFKDLQPEAIPDDIPACLEMVDAIAQNLVELLIKLHDAPRASSTSPVASIAKTTDDVAGATPAQGQVVVYLAETTRDLSGERSRVKSELLQFDCRVLPDPPLPQDADALSNAVRGSLQQAKISVHLIGAHYGAIPEMEKRSVPHIQYDLAAEASQNGSLSQLVWMPGGLTPKEASQQEFIEMVKKSSPEFLQVGMALLHK